VCAFYPAVGNWSRKVRRPRRCPTLEYEMGQRIRMGCVRHVPECSDLVEPTPCILIGRQTSSKFFTTVPCPRTEIRSPNSSTTATTRTSMLPDAVGVWMPKFVSMFFGFYRQLRCRMSISHLHDRLAVQGSDRQTEHVRFLIDTNDSRR
jgi:hypothetical protein